MSARRSRAKAPLAISVGCPSGIGPEVTIAAAAVSRTPCLLVGDIEVLRTAAARVGVGRRASIVVDDERGAARLAAGQVGLWAPSAAVGGPVVSGRPDRRAGRAQLAWIDQALTLVSSGVARGMVTGPVSKEAIAQSGAPGAADFRGHTEYLASKLGAREVVMAFWSRKLTTALVTTHLPLARVARAITASRVATTTYWLARLARTLGRQSPHLCVAALNPHAGEGGLLGNQEGRHIEPGIARARARLKADGVVSRIDGPVGAETAFRRALSGDYDGVVAMYHDQATIPSKLVSFGDAVNVTLGLPIVRTSVDHGTGYDIAGSGRADSAGMASAIQLAARLTRDR